jgi:bifunctional non-homologous end joining protein LigD
VDYTERFAAIADAVRALPVDDCMLDGEAVAFNDATYDFHPLRSRPGRQSASMIAFDLLDIEGADLRGRPVEERRGDLAEVLEHAPGGLSFSQEIEGDGPEIFVHPCELGLEGIVAKRRATTSHRAAAKTR